MAEDTKVGGIVFDLSAPTADVEKAGQTVPRVFAEIDKKVTGSLSNVAAAVKATAATFIAQFGARALIGTLNELLSKQKELKLASEALGISTKDLSAYQYALKTIGIEGEATTAILRTLYQRMSDRDKLSEGVRIFDALNVSTRDSQGQLRSFSSILPELANKFASMRDGVEKSRLAVMLFGEKGLELLPLLNRGSAGIEALTQKAERLGIVYDAKTNAAAVRLNKSFSELSNTGAGFADSVFKQLIPTLQLYADVMNKSAVNTNNFKTASEILTTVIKGFMVAGDVAFTLVSTRINAVVDAFKALGKAVMLDFEGAKEVMRKSSEESADALKGLRERIDDVFSGARESGNEFKNAFKQLSPPVVKTAEEISKALEEIKKQNRAMLDDLMADKRMDPVEKLARLEEMARKGQATFREFAASARELNQEIGMGELNKVLELDTAPAMEKLAALDEARARGVLGWYEYQRAVKGVTDQQTANMNDLVGAVGSSLTQIFKKSKAAAIAQALINTYQGITKAIAQYPPPISYAMAGVQAALGFAQVAAIRSQSESGTGGGASGVSSATAAAQSAPVETPAASSTLTVQGINPAGLFTGEVVRSLADQLLQFQRDGGRVILA